MSDYAGPLILTEHFPSAFRVGVHLPAVLWMPGNSGSAFPHSAQVSHELESVVSNVALKQTFHTYGRVCACSDRTMNRLCPQSVTPSHEALPPRRGTVEEGDRCCQRSSTAVSGLPRWRAGCCSWDRPTEVRDKETDYDGRQCVVLHGNRLGGLGVVGVIETESDESRLVIRP